MTIKLLVCDFDNTLYDWVSYFVPSLYRMVARAAALLECPEEELLDELRAVHQERRDSEHPFALLETKTVRSRYEAHRLHEAAELLDSAFHEFNKSRKETLVLYSGVRETLAAIDSSGVRIVGHTEAKYLAVLDRLERLGLSTYFNRVYCRERSSSSRPESFKSVRNAPRISTDVVQLSHHQAKPSPDVLSEICEREGFLPSSVAYVGDSLFKDILMANRAGVYSIWAKYGTAGYHGDYERLVRVSHWRDEDIAYERQLRSSAGEIVPDATLEHGFHELLSLGLFEVDGRAPQAQRA